MKRKAKARKSNHRPLPPVDVTTMYDTLTLEDYKRLRGDDKEAK
tara:strand:+ start:262 stop:393 length:132 start_codon:yes stop_codon:yes gene_type:complete